MILLLFYVYNSSVLLFKYEHNLMYFVGKVYNELLVFLWETLAIRFSFSLLEDSFIYQFRVLSGEVWSSSVYRRTTYICPTSSLLVVNHTNLFDWFASMIILWLVSLQDIILIFRLSPWYKCYCNNTIPHCFIMLPSNFTCILR